MILEFLRTHQLNLMLVIEGVCGLLAVFVSFTKSLSPRRRHTLFGIETSATVLLVADRFAYIYRGNASITGFYMVRISNFLVFFLSLALGFLFNLYLTDLYTNEGGLKKVPAQLRIAHYLAFFGMGMLVISQFTHFYYTFDEMNRYQRGSLFFVCYLVPFSMLLLQFSVIVRHYKKLNRIIRVSVLLFTLLPIIATVAQIFFYGLSLTNISIVGMAVMLYLFALLDLNATLEMAKQREIDFYREEQQHIEVLFSQTAEALASAIDAKDSYTHGHSVRVAKYSRNIAQIAGKSEKECREVYIAALLHDVGKIGIPNAIINKDEKLTDEEYSVIKTHPVIGNQILAHITQSPYISLGAHYHHERYDGKGYPDGLAGEEIPEIARIIAVADAYDAMTSKRSYRDPLPQAVVREQIERGVRTQFDPQFAAIMLEMMAMDMDYDMKEM